MEHESGYGTNRTSRHVRSSVANGGKAAYHNLQLALGQLIGSDVHPAVPWTLSFLNGSATVGLIFGRTFRWLPGKTGAAKGLLFGLFFWVVMGLVFFPLLGLGVFATGIGLGIAPAIFSLAMFLAYSVTLGIVYSALQD